MTGTVKDVQKFGRWVQRTWVGGKYVWTESGVMWNGIKRRTNDKFTETHSNHKYIGSINRFKSFESFIAWAREQVGYGMSYNLDSDILRPTGSCKIYSEETCLLIPSNLNRFIQGSKGSGTGVKGVCFDNRRQLYLAQCSFEDDHSACVQKRFKHFKNLDDAKTFYEEAKNKYAEMWLHRLISGEYIVDQRVISFMMNWRAST